MQRDRGSLCPLPKSCPLLSRPGEQWEEELWGNVVPARLLPLEGLTREGALGGTEMQDRLHILEDLNMLYIRQMALSLEVMTPHPPPPVHLFGKHPSSSLCPAHPYWG